MDISFVSQQDKFNYRVCAVILSENRILAMRDERSPYYYLPERGKRFILHEGQHTHDSEYLEAYGNNP